MTKELAIQELITVASTLKQTSQGEAVMMGIAALSKSDTCDGCRFAEGSGMADPCVKCKRLAFDYWSYDNE